MHQSLSLSPSFHLYLCFSLYSSCLSSAAPAAQQLSSAVGSWPAPGDGGGREEGGEGAQRGCSSGPQAALHTGTPLHSVKTQAHITNRVRHGNTRPSVGRHTALTKIHEWMDEWGGNMKVTQSQSWPRELFLKVFVYSCFCTKNSTDSRTWGQQENQKTAFSKIVTFCFSSSVTLHHTDIYMQNFVAKKKKSLSADE